MKWSTDLQRRFGFTQNEIRVILVLSLSLLAGTVIKWLRTSDGVPGVIRPVFDYARADSEFSARSHSAPDEPAAPAEQRTGRSHKRTLSLPPSSVDINAATKQQLILLPGIGESFAERIILYREEHGPFRSVDDLRSIRGIGPGIIAKIRPYVRVGRVH